MQTFLKSLRLLGDPSRLRLALLLEQEELSVAELQEILGMGQSRISTHLSQMKQAGLVEDRRVGKSALYRLGKLPDELLGTLRLGARELPDCERDRASLQLVLRKRTDKARAYFDELAGKFGRQYVPGRSWKALAETLIQLMPPLVIADLGAGEATLAQMLAQRAERVIAVDSSQKMVEYGSDLAQRHGFTNLEYLHGDIEDPPIADQSVDLAIFSQALHHAEHPERALRAAWRILRPGGRVAVLDLKRHTFEEAHELYADRWLGFSLIDLEGFLTQAGFRDIHLATVHREEEYPHFETVLAVGVKG
jgi:ArsR family transcriptional regulator